MKKIIIGGIGSVLLGDDGVGPYVAGVLDSEYRFQEGVTVADLGTPGLDLVAHFFGVDVVILIDSVENGEAPGAVTLYRKEDVLRHGPARVRMDPHSPALSESLLIAELGGEGPEEILLIGITGEQYEVGAELSEAARGAVNQAVNEVLAELKRRNVSYLRLHKNSYSAWWKPTTEGLPARGRCEELTSS